MLKSTSSLAYKITWLDINSSYSHSTVALPAIDAQHPTSPNIIWSKVSGTINSVISSIIEELIISKPDIIAYTAWLFNHDIVLSILSRYKAIYPDVIIIGGGAEYLGNNASFLRAYDFISLVVRGEGEEVFHQWVDIANDNSQWDKVKGLCYINQHGVYQDNGLAKVENYENLKYPEDSSFFSWDKPFIQIESSRGCFNSCAFCVSGADKPVRSLSIDLLRGRLNRARIKGVRDIRLLDRTFNGTGTRAIELLSLFEEYADDMQFHLEVHPALFTPELRSKIKTLPKGLLHIEAGVQSLCQKVLDKSSRYGKIEDVIDGLIFLSSCENLEVHSDLIAGLPHYSLQMIYDDVNSLSKIGCSEIQLELLKLLPGTVMRNDANKLGIIYSPITPYEVMQTPYISYIELQESRRLSRVIDMYYNCKVWQESIKELINSDNNFMLNFTKHLTSIDMIDQPLSMERRGLLLFEYCKKYYPNSIISVTACWIKGGLSLKRGAGEGAKSYKGEIPIHIISEKEKYGTAMRLYSINMNQTTIWFGYDRSISHSKPLFVKIENIKN